MSIGPGITTEPRPSDRRVAGQPPLDHVGVLLRDRQRRAAAGARPSSRVTAGATVEPSSATAVTTAGAVVPPARRPTYLLSGCWNEAFERVAPVRGFPSYRGQRNWPGLWWFAGTGEHVGYESWVERDALMTMDTDPAVVTVAAQPMWLRWTDERSGRGGAPRPGLPRPPRQRRRRGHRRAPRPPDPGTRRRSVRGHRRDLRAGRLGLPARRRARPDPRSEPALAGRLPPSALRATGPDGAAAGGVHRADTAAGRRRRSAPAELDTDGGIASSVAWTRCSPSER